jgi:alpha-L-fucosidase
MAEALWSNSLTARPSSAQIAWQEREVELFLHFGINTFAGVEWGSGQASPRLFNPTNLDCRQWVDVARSGGARGAVLTVKHHDGFCLWPTDTTDYSVRASPWQVGKGDVVREFADACREAGLAAGLYLSPADLHEPSYGRDHAAYNEFFRRQLRELLTRYGEVSEIWFDGVTPGNLRQQHDWASYYRVIRELQPQTVIVTRGPDVRWVGNEAGIARESDWSVIPLPLPAADHDWPDMIGDLGSRARWKESSHAHWYPAVATVSLRPGWFWAPGEDHRLRERNELLRFHDQTVGRNDGLLFNVPPDRTRCAVGTQSTIPAFERFTPGPARPTFPGQTPLFLPWVSARTAASPSCRSRPADRGPRPPTGP